MRAISSDYAQVHDGPPMVRSQFLKSCVKRAQDEQVKILELVGICRNSHGQMLAKSMGLSAWGTMETADQAKSQTLLFIYLQSFVGP